MDDLASSFPLPAFAVHCLVPSFHTDQSTRPHQIADPFTNQSCLQLVLASGYNIKQVQAYSTSASSPCLPRLFLRADVLWAHEALFWLPASCRRAISTPV